MLFNFYGINIPYELRANLYVVRLVGVRNEYLKSGAQSFFEEKLAFAVYHLQNTKVNIFVIV